jgi:hypothetical protein
MLNNGRDLVAAKGAGKSHISSVRQKCPDGRAGIFAHCSGWEEGLYVVGVTRGQAHRVDGCERGGLVVGGWAEGKVQVYVYIPIETA